MGGRGCIGIGDDGCGSRRFPSIGARESDAKGSDVGGRGGGDSLLVGNGGGGTKKMTMRQCE